MQLKSKYLTLLSALLMASCSDNDMSTPETNLSDGEQAVTLSVTIENSSVLSRTADYEISDGSKIDVLLYAVYDENGNLIPSFQGGNNGYFNGLTSDDIVLGTGQNAMKIAKGQTVKISLMINKTKNYKVAFWSQSSQCKYYTTTDLKNLTVSYEGLNNDESRDAFCGNVAIKNGAAEKELVVLQRPFAQINVGTTGADYINNNKRPGGYFYPYSKIKMTGVANTLNVLTDEIGEATQAEISFGYNGIPAYLEIGKDLSELQKEIADSGYVNYERFLKVQLIAHEGNEWNYLDYKKDYPTIDYTNVYLTESFKYLSMCYVLVPGTVSAGSSLQDLTVIFSKNNNGDDPASSLRLTNVPVQRNHRTNILGGLNNIKPNTDPDDPDNPGPDPDDPDNPGPDPDDPDNPVEDETTLFKPVMVKVTINKEYMGDNNRNVNNDSLPSFKNPSYK